MRSPDGDDDIFNRYLGEDVEADLAQEYLREITRAETELAKIENEAKSSR
jgi:hypothetical protein